MATFRQIKNKSGTKWRAEVHVNNKRESRRFDSKPEAREWALQREVELSRADRSVVAGMTLRAALERYAAEVSVAKRGARWEQIRINKLCRDPIAAVTLLSLELSDLEDFRDRRLNQVKASSVTRELTILKSVVRQAVRWKWLDVYPWSNFQGPKGVPPRTRVYSQDEIEAIVKAAGIVPGEIRTYRSQVGVMFLFALETAMRLGEIAAMRWSNVNIDLRTVHIPDSKTGKPRDVPLTTRAVELLSWMPQDRETVFSVGAQSASTQFRTIRKLAGIEGATFHDARRHATSNLAKKLELLELVRVTGHSDTKMLLVYYQRSAAEMAQKLD